MFVKLKEKYRSLPVQVKASFWFLICSFLQKGISVLTTPIFTRLLTPAEYGNYNVFNSWLGIVSIFVSLNLSMGVYGQGIVKFSKERKEFSSSLQGLTLVLITVWTIVYLFSKAFWNNLFSLSTTQMLAMLIMIWTSSIFGFWSSEQRVEYKYKLLVLITLIVSIAKPVIGIIFVVNANDKVTARILGIALVELAVYLWLFVFQLYKGKKFFVKKFWIYALAFNIPLIPHYLSQIVLSSVDRIMIKEMIGETSAGIYSLAYSLSLIMTLFNNALGQTINPWLYQKIRDNDIKSISTVAYFSLIIVALCNILLIALAPEVIAIFAPKSYYEAIWVIPPVAMSVFFMFAYDLFAKFEFYYAKTKLIALTTIGCAVLNIGLNYVFINLFGYIAAGYTTLVCYLLYALFHYMAMQKVCREKLDGIYPYNTKIIFSISLIFLAIGFFFLVLYNYAILRYSAILLIIIIVFLKRKKIISLIKLMIANKATLTK
ncbi:MAG: oligosaccharide flippase family protein [Bacilli bacterium]|nr:oligosaccharide flippase family protein [Bacilli bacterium]